MRQALTDVAVKAIPIPAKGATTIYDGTMPGFGVRVSQGGTRAFIVKYGKKRLLKTIGSYPSMSLKTARREASAFLATANPNPTRITAAEAITAFLEHSGRKNKERTTTDYKRLLNRHFPSGKLSGLNRQQLLNTLSALSGTPAEQSHALAAFNVFLNWCSVNGHIEQNPLLGIRGLGHVQQRERILSLQELIVVLKKALEQPYPFGQIVLLCLLTGQRRGEVAALRRDYIAGSTITLPSWLTKNKREHTFPIGDFTKQVLATIPHEKGYLFPGKFEGIWNGWGKAKSTFDEGLKVKPYTLHDLRRTFASSHAEIGTPVHIVEKLLNHVSGTFAGVAGVYNRHTYADEMREACTAYEAHLLSLFS
ncbi:MAG: site-specific integrase [Devosia sp.]|nr:site-specific integrase [Devosia sp.]